MVVGVGWNAGAVRARLLARHRLGRDGRRALASHPSLDDALTTLRDGPYGHDVRPSMPLAAARWHVAATPLWHLRILAGWLPPAGGALASTLVGWWEILNIENLLAALDGADALPPHELGSLDTAWDVLRDARSAAEVRSGLAASAWRDPGSDRTAAIVPWLRVSWAQRVADLSAEAARLAAGWAALVASRELLLGDRARAAGMPPSRELGPRWTEADGLAGLADRLPAHASWVLRDLDDAEQLWIAERRWWRRLEDEAFPLVGRPASGGAAVVGLFGLLLADAHGVQGALALAARGGGTEAVIDELL